MLTDSQGNLGLSVGESGVLWSTVAMRAGMRNHCTEGEEGKWRSRESGGYDGATLLSGPGLSRLFADSRTGIS